MQNMPTFLYIGQVCAKELQTLLHVLAYMLDVDRFSLLTQVAHSMHPHDKDEDIVYKWQWQSHWFCAQVMKIVSCIGVKTKDRHIRSSKPSSIHVVRGNSEKEVGTGRLRFDVKAVK